jgi:hypothetical protein
MSVTTRIQELNNRLATNLVSKGVSAEGTETTTELINKVNDIESGGTSVINPEWTDWRYFSYYDNRNDLVARLKYSDTANGKNFSNMFYACSSLTTIPQLDTSNGTNFGAMFNGCRALTSILQLSTSNGTNFNGMFSGCTALTTISLLNMSSMSGTSYVNMFYNCTALENVTFEGTIPVRGNMSVFSSCPNLTVESLMSFINALTNMSDTATYTITIGSTNLAKLTEEQIQIATDKRITLQ